MSNKAITKNDLAAVLNEVLPPTPSEYKKLLWTNPSPSSAFAAQTVISGADLTEYDAFDIVMHASMSNTQSGYSNIVTKGTSGTMVTGSAPSANDSWYGVRKITITDTSITFGNGGYYYLAGGGNDLNNNNYGIPYQIYGIKYERVSPPQIEYPNYSTEEQQVGTWIDGKPIYRKVLTLTTTTGYYTVDVSSLKIKTPIRADIISHASNGGGWNLGNYYVQSSDSLRVFFNSLNQIYIVSGSSYSFGETYLILEYTKTTD